MTTRSTSLLVIAAAVISLPVAAQTPATGTPPTAQRPVPASTGRSIARSAPTLAPFFTGAWSCSGAFANGRPIEQTMEFRELLGGAWISATNDDRPPASYHAFALWGALPSDALVANIADSQGGMRRFVAPQGWNNDQVAFVRDTMIANSRRYAERFTYARQSDTSFRMTYEVQLDTLPWREGDHLTCTRSAGK